MKGLNESGIDMQPVLDIAKRAGDAILQVYGSNDFGVEVKEDESPLTLADQASNAVIEAGLKEAYPEIPILSEEMKEVPYSERSGWESYWLVDPLDGTKEFIKRNGEFTVNIALVRNGSPVFGVVYQPVGERLYYGGPAGGSYLSVSGAEEEKIEGGGHYSEEHDVVVVASRSHLTDAVMAFVDELTEQGKEVTFLSAGSSLKLCLVAEGKATVYPRFGPTMEWDTAAAHAVAVGAGKKVINHESGEPLEYNKENLLNPWFIVE